MLRLSAHRRLIAILTLFMLFAPFGVMAASVWSGSSDHQHMHHGNHGASIDATTLEQAAHDRLLCSVVVPCEHGFCAGLAIIEANPQGPVHGDAWHDARPVMAHAVCPDAHSPPPRPFS